MNDASTTELDGLFQRELESINNDVRRAAALTAFQKLQPSNHITVEQFLTAIQRHSEMWAVVSTLGIVEFAESLLGSRPPIDPERGRQRTRISDEQQNALKDAVLQVLDGKTGA